MSLAVVLFLHVGHFVWAAMAALMHCLQKMWPHFVLVSSTNGPMQTGQLNTGSFGGGGGGGGGGGAGATRTLGTTFP